MVEKHIKSLLYDHDCVIIPDFGGLITRYVSARINPVKHTFLPPSKKVAFNEKLILNDGLLISTMAFRDNISKAEAEQRVKDFVFQAKAKLQAEKRFALQDIGVFKYNTEHRLEFEFVESDNLLENSFGLPELTVRPIRFEEPAVLRTLRKDREPEQNHVKRPFRSRLKKAYNVAAGLALIGLSASALYFLSLQTDYNLSSLNPISLFNQSFKSGEMVSSDKYAADYVPFSEEERIVNYKSILPAFAVSPVMDEVEEIVVQETAEIDSSDYVAGIAHHAVNEEDAPAETVAKVENTAEPVLTIKEKTDRFYIIAGGYSTYLNAENSRYSIHKKGFDSKVIYPLRGSKLFRVSVADFDTEQEAVAALDKYKDTFGETIWVFKN